MCEHLSSSLEHFGLCQAFCEVFVTLRGGSSYTAKHHPRALKRVVSLEKVCKY
jgi:hypothetical protein